MKKVISLLLALLMAFSFMTVASAEETTTEAPTTESTDILPEGALGEYDWILDLPFWTVGPALKFAKIAFKLVSAYLKVAKIFGLVEADMEDMILDAVLTLIENAQNGEAVEETTTAPAAEAA